MTRGGRVVGCLVVVAAALAVVGLLLATEGPTVHTASDGDYTCYAPYDIVLNDVHPTGMPVNYHEVQTACRQAGEHRFYLAIVAEAAAAVIAALAMVTLWCRSRALLAEEMKRRRHLGA